MTILRNLQQLRSFVKAAATVLLAVALALFGMPAIGFHSASAYAMSAGGTAALRAQGDLVPVDAAANRQAAQAVADAIAALPDAAVATADDAEAYATAQAAFDALTDAQRAHVAQADVDKLAAVGAAVLADQQAREAEAARAKKEAADRAAAKAVRDLIAALPAAKDAKASDEAAVTAAQNAYNALTADQKAFVDKASVDKLAALATAVAAAKKAQVAADKAAAKVVTTQIAKLPSAKAATAENEKAVKAAKKAYDALTAAQKAYVPKASRDKLAAVLEAVAKAVANRDAQQGESGSSSGEGSNSDSGSQGDGDEPGGEGDGSDAGGDAGGGDAGDSQGGDTPDGSSGEGDDPAQGDDPSAGSTSGSGKDSGSTSGSGSSSSGSTTPGGSSSSGSAAPTTPTNVRPGKNISPDEVYSIDLYATATNSDSNWVRPVLDDEADADGLHWLKSGIKEKGGRLKLLVRAAWGDGRAFWQYDEDWRTLDLRFESSDTSVATVSSAGVVTATGDGEAVLSVTEQSSGLVARLGLRVAGQQGAYVEQVYICDETGYQYEDERITFKDTANKLNLYVRQALSDGTTVSNAPGADDYAPDSLTPTVWSISDSDIGSVNSESGVFIPKALGSVKVYATATGGDPDVQAGKVRGFVWVVIDDGEYNTTGDMPSDELTVNVIYDAYDQRDEDGAYRYIVKSQHYTLDELKALESAQCTYTLTRSDGGYVTSSAEGIHLLTLIEGAGLGISQVKSFTFTALDGVNPGKMTYSFLFGERYYWPNYEFGGNLSEGTSVFPMLAWVSDWRDSKSGAEDSSANYDDLPDGTRLRLLFGSSTTADNKTDHSLKYISEMTIRIAGAPDVTAGKAEDGSGNDDEDGGATDPGKDESGDGSGEDEQDQPEQQAVTPAVTEADSSNQSAQPDEQKSPAAGPAPAPSAGPASPKASDPGSDGGKNAAKDLARSSGKSSARKSQSANPGQGATGATPSQVASDRSSEPAAAEATTESATEAADEAATEAATEAADETAAEAEAPAEEQQAEGSSAPGESGESSQRWRAYQMLNPEDNSNLQIDALNDNPLVAWAIALVIGSIVAGGIGRGVTFRRQLAS